MGIYSPERRSLTFVSFATGSLTDGSNITYSLRTTDINGDGKTDVVFGTQNSGGIQAIMNSYTSGTLVTGNFSTYSNIASGLVSGLAMDDFNNDGKVDLIACSYFSSNILLITSTVAIYYAKSTGASNLQTLSNWSSAADGTGSAPASFANINTFSLSNSSGTTSFSIGTALTISGTVIIPSGATLAIGANDLTINGNLTNSGTITSSTGATILGGSTGQSISGTGAYGNLTVNNSNGITFSGNPTINGTLALTAGTMYMGSSTIFIKGAVSRTSGAINATSGTVTFNGSSAQSVTSSIFSGTPATFVVNNSNGVSLTQPVTVGALTLTNGKLDIGAHIFTATSSSGASAGSYVQTTAAGALRISVANSGAVSFPVGNIAYNPVTITNNSGSADNFTARVLDEVYVNGSSGTVFSGTRVQRTWDIGKTNPNGGTGVNFVFNWNVGEVVGAFVTPTLYHYASGWVKQTGTTSSGATSLTYTGYTSTFSPFAIVESNSTLPVTWLSFTAQKNNRTTVLNWSTETEQGTYNYTIQRSTNETDWKAIGKQSAAGNSNTIQEYTFTDVNPVNGINYYRLLQMDADNKISYSKIVSVSFSENSKSFSVYPNPVINGNITVKLNKTAAVQIVNSMGMTVLRKELQAGLHKLTLQQLPKGLYRINNGEETISFVIQ